MNQHDIPQLRKVQKNFVILMNILPLAEKCDEVFVQLDLDGAMYIVNQIVRVWSVAAGDPAFDMTESERATLWFMFCECRHINLEDESGMCVKCVRDFLVLMLRLLALVEYRSLDKAEQHIQ
jgi:hypothetical protein